METIDLVSVLVIGAGSGFGSAVGTELARYLVSRLRSRRKIEFDYA